MRTRRPRGISLVETLVAASLSALIAAAAAVHVRTLRQVADLTHARREALQNARVAIDRIARQVRAAKLVAAVTPSHNLLGSITLTDAQDVNHVFALQGAELRYGIAAATDTLATGIQALSFRGYSPQGEVADDQPELMNAVEITLAAAVGGTSDTVALSTRVQLRRAATTIQARSSISYASLYLKTGEQDVINYWLGFGPPDLLLCSKASRAAGRFYGFQPGVYQGTVHRIFAGMNFRLTKNVLNVTVRYDGTTLGSYSLSPAYLTPGLMTWYWFDITDSRPSWSDGDVARLSYEVWGTASADFECFAIRAFFDPPEFTTYWADREGNGMSPNQWVAAPNALAAPDGVFATAPWATKPYQSFRVTPPASEDEILTVQVCLHGGISLPLLDDTLDVRVVLPSQKLDEGTPHILRAADLNPYQPYTVRKGDILVDVTHDLPLTWEALSRYEIRFHSVLTLLADSTLYADAVGWRVLRVVPQQRGIIQWSE